MWVQSHANILGFWVMISCSLVCRHHHFVGTCYHRSVGNHLPDYTAIQIFAENKTSNFIISWLWTSMTNCPTSNLKNITFMSFRLSTYSEVTRYENLKTNLTSYERFNSYSGDWTLPPSVMWHHLASIFHLLCPLNQPLLMSCLHSFSLCPWKCHWPPGPTLLTLSPDFPLPPTGSLPVTLPLENDPLKRQIFLTPIGSVRALVPVSLRTLPCPENGSCRSIQNIVNDLSDYTVSNSRRK